MLWGNPETHTVPSPSCLLLRLLSPCLSPHSFCAQISQFWAKCHVGCTPTNRHFTPKPASATSCTYCKPCNLDDSELRTVAALFSTKAIDYRKVMCARCRWRRFWELQRFSVLDFITWNSLRTRPPLSSSATESRPIRLLASIRRGGSRCRPVGYESEEGIFFVVFWGDG